MLLELVLAWVLKLTLVLRVRGLVSCLDVGGKLEAVVRVQGRSSFGASFCALVVVVVVVVVVVLVLLVLLLLSIITLTLHLELHQG